MATTRVARRSSSSKPGHTSYEATYTPESFIRNGDDVKRLKARIYAPYKGADRPLPELDAVKSGPRHLSILNREDNPDARWRCLYLKLPQLPGETADQLGNATVVFPNNIQQRPKQSWVNAVQEMWISMAPAFKSAGLRNVRYVFSNDGDGGLYLHIACEQEGNAYQGSKARAFHDVLRTPLGDDSIRIRMSGTTTKGKNLFKLAGYLADALITWKTSRNPALQEASVSALTGVMMESLKS